MVNFTSLNIFYFWVGLLVFRFSLLQSNLLEVFFQNVQLHKLQHWLHYNFVRFIHLKKKEKHYLSWSNFIMDIENFVKAM